MEQALKPESQGNVAVEPVAWRYRIPVYGHGAFEDWKFTANERHAREYAHTDGQVEPLVPASSIASLSEGLAEVERERDDRPRTIDIEKLLLAKLGREWTPTGISIASLIEELARERDELRAKLAEARETVEPFARILSDEYDDVSGEISISLTIQHDAENPDADEDFAQLNLIDFRRARAFRDAISEGGAG